MEESQIEFVKRKNKTSKNVFGGSENLSLFSDFKYSLAYNLINIKKKSVLLYIIVIIFIIILPTLILFPGFLYIPLMLYFILCAILGIYSYIFIIIAAYNMKTVENKK